MSSSIPNSDFVNQLKNIIRDFVKEILKLPYYINLFSLNFLFFKVRIPPYPHHYSRALGYPQTIIAIG
jgi:hypothetical protein